MQTSGQRLQHFIQDFLSYTVLETGEMKMQYETGNMNACLSEVCRLWAHRFQERGWRSIFWPTRNCRIRFDSAKIQRVISNLLENASKFTPSGGTVWLHAEPYMWERRSPNSPAMPAERRRQTLPLPNSVKVSVSDTGPGIPPEYHIEVFDDFFRLPDSEESNRRHGVGPCHRAPVGQWHGWQNLGGKRTGGGSKIFVYRAPETACQHRTVKGKRNERSGQNPVGR